MQKLENDSKLLSSMIQIHFDRLEDDSTYFPNTKRKFSSTIATLLKIESEIGFQINASMLEDSIQRTKIQDAIVKYYRSNGRKDSTIKNYLTVLNVSINNFNKYTGNNIPTFVKSDTTWSKESRQIFHLNENELKALYNLVYNPEPESELKPTALEIKKLKYFLFRCFCGMRIGDMNKENIQESRLKRYFKRFSYLQDKGTKTATVNCLGTYLNDIARSLNWEFPKDLKSTNLTYLGHIESLTVRKYLKLIFKDKIRKIEFYSENGLERKDLSEVVSTHTARKTFAHLIYRLSNYNLLSVVKQLGHTKLEQTQNYLGIDLNEESIDYKNVNLGF